MPPLASRSLATANLIELLSSARFQRSAVWEKSPNDHPLRRDLSVLSNSTSSCFGSLRLRRMELQRDPHRLLSSVDRNRRRWREAPRRKVRDQSAARSRRLNRTFGPRDWAWLSFGTSGPSTLPRSAIWCGYAQRHAMIEIEKRRWLLKYALNVAPRMVGADNNGRASWR